VRVLRAVLTGALYEQWETAVQRSLSTLAEVPICSSLNAASKQQFLEYWHATFSGTSKKRD
jgi:hypothetical protein